ncbi:DUF1127 domain-containing protein [Devosia albogilva]|uniref:DUF1127 domain-containing protein n=1 Tax=Devosia albogilva TaxID=429726 RepID=A0ABW5QJZ9_9HYPH
MLEFLDAWRLKRRHRQTQLHLAELSDHLLADIGISRAEIIELDAYRTRRKRHGAGR